MKFIPTDIPGVVVAEPEIHRDARGFFFEAFHEKKYREGGIDAHFVQDNHSRSTRGTLRGLHMQLTQMQGKLIRVLHGSIWDVCVDVRRGSPSFGRHFALELDAETHRQLYAPPGMAHGFVVTSDTAEVEYKCTDFYAPGDELSIQWNDPELGIPWPVEEPILSAKDAAASPLASVLDRLPKFAG